MKTEEEIRKDERKKICSHIERALLKDYSSSAYTGMFGQTTALENQKRAVLEALKKKGW